MRKFKLRAATDYQTEAALWYAITHATTNRELVSLYQWKLAELQR